MVEVKWEPKEGKIYAILYKKMLEVFNVEDEKACSTAIFDVISTSFDFIGTNQICVANEQGNFTILKNIQNDDSIQLNIIHTKFPRIRQIKTCFSQGNFNFLAAISTDCKLSIFSCDRLLAFSEDLEELKADRVVKSKTRLTCLAINNLNEVKLGKREKSEPIDSETPLKKLKK